MARVVVGLLGVLVLLITILVAVRAGANTSWWLVFWLCSCWAFCWHS